jgi:signal transduction histidine kinase/ligand-binding sensor domain-containing protein
VAVPCLLFCCGEIRCLKWEGLSIRASFQYAFCPLMLAAPLLQPSNRRSSNLRPKESTRRECFHNRRWICAKLFVLALSSLSGWLPRGAAIASVTTTQASTRISTGVRAPIVSAGVVNVPVFEGGSARFTRVSTADGLSQSRVSQFVQDDRGFIWFGTQYGLDRYDGYEFKVFVHEPGRMNSLAGAYIYSLYKDRSGMLWIGCNRTLDRFDPRTETFTHYQIETDDLANLGSTVVHISQDRSGLLWLATATGLHRLDPTTGTIVHYRHSAENSGGLSTNDVTWSGEDRNGDFWVGTADGLDKFDRATSKVMLHIPMPDPARVAFFEDRFGQFWIYHNLGTGLALYDRATNILTKYSFYRPEPSPDADTGVSEMIEDQNGNLWLGTRGLGLLQFDRDKGCFRRFRNHPSDPHSIGEDRVIALFQDREGNIWTGLHSTGPNHFSPNKSAFEVFKHQADDPNSLSVDFVNAIFEDSRGSLWLANDDGVSRFDRKTGKLMPITVGIGAKPMIIDITEDHSGVLWFGTFARGLYSYDPDSGRLKAYRHSSADTTSLSSDLVYRTFEDHAGNLWVATDDGLDLLDRNRQSFHVYKPDLDARIKQIYVRIAEDEKGTLWLGTSQSGLHHFDPVTHRFTIYKSDPSDPNGLRDDGVGAIHVASNHLIWIGTENGLNRLDPATGKFASYDSRNGLSGNAIDCILEDDHGYLWMNTNKGLSRFNPNDGMFANYSEADGLPGTDLTGWAACSKSRRGELFFAGFAGAVGFWPNRVEKAPYSPQVVLTDLELSGAPATIGAGGPLAHSIAYANSIVLTHEMTIFSLTFAGLRYFSPESNRYRYKLEGLENKWYVVDSNKRRVTYTTLPAGAYTFRVQAATTTGDWNEPGTSLQIVMLPAWWATWWFRAIYVSLFALAIWVAFVFRMRRLSRQLTIRMQERVNERTRIARELHDTLLQGLISASLQLEVADRQIASDANAKPLVQRVSQLLRQLIDESRHTVRHLRLRRSQEENLERALTQISTDLAAPRKVKYQVIVEGTPYSLRPRVRDEIYRIGGEALANAFRHADASAVETMLEYGRDHFRLLVRDDGRGIDPEVLRAGREGHFGLSGLRERARKIGARLKIRTGAGAGTEIDLIVPSSAAFERPDPHGPVYWITRLYSRVSRP